MSTRSFTAAARLVSALAVLFLLTLASSYAAPLTAPCMPGAVYDPACDVDADGDVDTVDIQTTAGHFNQSGVYTSDNNHNHLGQTWNGSNNSLTITGAFSPNPPLLLANTTGDGLRATTNASNGVGAEGTATAASGSATGVSGKSFAAGGVGVAGNALATTGNSYGVTGQSSSSSGRGVWGVAASTTGTTTGVYGQSTSTAGAGVRAYATASSGVTSGLYAEAASPEGRAVYGFATSGSGSPTGTYGQSAATAGTGAIGWASSASGNTVGVWGIANSTTGKGVHGYAAANSGLNYGVYGQGSSAAGYGVFGTNGASSGTGVRGDSNTGVGVHGYASNGVGVLAEGNGASTTALEIDGGAIQVTGAGLNTSTPVFQHRVTHNGAGANICTDGTFGFDFSYISHPMINNRSDALLLVTSSSDALIVRYSPIGCPAGRWTVSKPGLDYPTDNSTVNVLVVLP